MILSTSWFPVLHLNVFLFVPGGIVAWHWYSLKGKGIHWEKKLSILPDLFSKVGETAKRHTWPQVWKSWYFFFIVFHFMVLTWNRKLLHILFNVFLGKSKTNNQKRNILQVEEGTENKCKVLFLLAWRLHFQFAHMARISISAKWKTTWSLEKVNQEGHAVLHPIFLINAGLTKM